MSEKRIDAQRAHALDELERLTNELLAAGPGLRNKTLNDVALQIGHYVGSGSLAREGAETMLVAAARKIGLPESEARATVRSGIDAGIKEPAFRTERTVIPFPGARPHLPPPPPEPIEDTRAFEDIETWWLPTELREWVEAAHEALSVPRIMAVAAGLCAAATVLQGKVEVEVKPGWREPLSLYWVVFSPTGTLKSALIKAATAPIRKIQSTLKEEREPDLKFARREQVRIEAQLGRMRRATKAHRHTDGYQEHIQQIRELEHQLDELDTREAPRWLYDDINPTMVPRVLRSNQDSIDGIARMAVLDAEGTFLANLLGRHSGQTNVDPLLKGYGGEPIDMVRALHGSPKTQDFHISACHLTMCLLVQPHYYQQLVDEPVLGVNGFLGRCLMTHLPDNPEPRRWDAPAIPESVQGAYEGWIAKLAAIPAGTVFEAPEGSLEHLERIFRRLEDDRFENKGGAGWITRSLGRLCRIAAICRLSQLSQCPRGVGADSGAAGAREYISILNYILSPLYSAHLASSRLAEPTTLTTLTITPRLTRWLGQWTVGQIITLRHIYKPLHLSKNKGLEVADMLIEAGYLEQVNALIRDKKPVSLKFQVLAHPSPGERSAFEGKNWSQGAKDWWAGRTEPDPENDGR